MTSEYTKNAVTVKD